MVSLPQLTSLTRLRAVWSSLSMTWPVLSVMGPVLSVTGPVLSVWLSQLEPLRLPRSVS
jgi:hypothetical protein